jgi:RecA/RadA recombinase
MRKKFEFCSLFTISFVSCKQKQGGNAVLIDAEHAFDPEYSRGVGVDVENLIVCQPDNGEMALESTLLTSFCVAFVSCFVVFRRNDVSVKCLVVVGSVFMMQCYPAALIYCSHAVSMSCSKRFLCAAADRLCRSGAVDLICIDSVSALTPRAEIEV